MAPKMDRRRLARQLDPSSSSGLALVHTGQKDGNQYAANKLA